MLRFTKFCAVALSLFAFAQAIQAVDERAFPDPGSKKGLQVQMIDDALELGVKHAALNIGLTGLIDLEKRPENPTWQVDGVTYSFRRSYLDSLGVKKLSDAGVNVYLIVIATKGSEAYNNLVLHPARSPKLMNGIAAVNTVTDDGARIWRATMEFLADWFSRANDEHGRVAGYIIGNEVNVHHEWHDFGPMAPEKAVEDYLRQFRIAHTAVRRASANARLYIPLTHHWTLQPTKDPNLALPAKTFIDLFASQARAGGDFDWHIAYHPYPEDLGNPRTWEDRTATASPDSKRMTFKNLEQLQEYLERPELQFQGKSRRVILSEQGFHSTTGSDPKRGLNVQAAAYCYAWEKVARLSVVDAFILHRHVDHGQEGGLNLGLWTRKPTSVATPDAMKPIYDCFKAAGTPQQAEAFAFALPIIGIKSWDEVTGAAK